MGTRATVDEIEELKAHAVVTRKLPGRAPHTYREVAELGEDEARRREATRSAIESLPERQEAVDLIRALGTMRATAAVPTLALLFTTSPLPDVRTASGHALLSIDSVDARAALVDALEVDDAFGVATLLAIRALNRIHGARVFDVLGGYLSDAAIHEPGGVRRAQRILRAFSPSALTYEANSSFVETMKQWLGSALGLPSRRPRHLEWEEHATRILRKDDRWIRRAIELLGERSFESYARPMLGAISARKLDAALERWSNPPKQMVHAPGKRDFVARYAAGEHERVWREVRDLGPIRNADLRAEVSALAVSTMERVRFNVERVTERLGAAGYPFCAERPPFSPPTGHTEAAIARIEAATRAPCPVALRAFWTVVGEVDWRHSETDVASAPWGATPIAECDPLVLDGPAYVWYAVEEWLEARTHQHAEVVGPLDLGLAPDHFHKANISGGSPYSIRWSSCDGDPTFDYEPHETTFIEYLRICFRDGGFSRTERVGSDERARAFFAELRRGLDPF